MDRRPPARTLLEPCLRIDRKAETFYRRLAEAASDPDWGPVWGSLAEEEREHVGIWSRALADWGDQPVPGAFENPEELVRELHALEGRVGELVARTPVDEAGAVEAAFWLEFYLLDPAMDVLLLHAAERDGRPASLDYEEHIEAFVRVVERLEGRGALGRLGAETLRRLWKQNRIIARHLRSLHEIKTLIPICAGCKKIRDDAGYWRHLEAYLKTHAGLEFTHGLCPECTDRLYPELRRGGPEGEPGG